MYLVSVLLFLFVFPAASVLIEALHAGGGDLMGLIGKWFVFWGSGVRLFLAGVRQVSKPEFTAGEIFGIKDAAASGLVREVGFGNLSMGTLGLASLAMPEWLVPAAIVSGLYYGLAGVGHLVRERNAKEEIALWSDLAIFLLLAAFVANRLF